MLYMVFSPILAAGLLLPFWESGVSWTIIVMLYYMEILQWAVHAMSHLCPEELFAFCAAEFLHTSLSTRLELHNQALLSTAKTSCTCQWGKIWTMSSEIERFSLTTLEHIFLRAISEVRLVPAYNAIEIQIFSALVLTTVSDTFVNMVLSVFSRYWQLRRPSSCFVCRYVLSKLQTTSFCAT